MCLLWPVNCKLCFAAGPKKSKAAFLKSKSFLHESDKDKKSLQKRLVIKIHLCPIRVRVTITEIVTYAGNREMIQSPKHVRLLSTALPQAKIKVNNDGDYLFIEWQHCAWHMPSELKT